MRFFQFSVLLSVLALAASLVHASSDSAPSKKALGKRKAPASPESPEPVVRPEPAAGALEGFQQGAWVESEISRAVENSRHTLHTENTDLSSPGAGCSASADLWFDTFSGDVVDLGCRVEGLLPKYLRARNAVANVRRSYPDDNPVLDLEALDSKHLRQANGEDLRRSERLRALKPDASPQQTRTETPGPPARERPKPKDESALRWVDKTGALRHNTQTWKYDPKGRQNAIATSGARRNGSVSRQFVASQNRSPLRQDDSPLRKRTRRAGRNQKHKDGSVNPRRIEQLRKITLKRSNRIISPTFSLARHGSVSSTGWQGVQPHRLGRNEIRRLYFSRPNAADLMPYLLRFWPIPYITGDSPADERGTFVIDSDGLIFLYRSVRAFWLADCITELEEAQKILLGDELESERVRAEFADGVRGPHLAIIIGHQRQSAVEASLTLWHRTHERQVNEFLAQPIMGRIFRWVSDIVRIVWPGLAARFEEEAAWHKRESGIEPLFGYFWNFCLNAVFPGQSRIHTGPHVDFKNQIGVCMILTYVTSKGLNYNHRRRGWIVLWEAGIYVELPPWTLIGYPSSLFYHFNVDVDQLQTVYTDDDVDIPTPENSTPYDDSVGRGSMVFFSQSTMSHGPATGFHTLDEAARAGVSRTTDYGNDIQAAFRDHAYLETLPDDIIAAMSDALEDP
ncbi:hypothetical protein C8R43DRAFT_1230274 [Mycena crocata]|nr:hypothetical protein C8R43DRAFT_1230274 [Mycena crocata]